jgi:hypothetical protein
MDWRMSYETAARRHRELARAARAAQFLYLASLHVRAAELLDAEASASPWRPMSLVAGSVHMRSVPG